MSWLDRSIFFAGCMMEVFLLYDYFYNFFEVKIKRKLSVIIFWGTCLLLFAVTLLQDAVINLMLVPIILWTFVTIIFETNFGLRIGYFSTAYFVMIGVEFLYGILSETTATILAETGLVRVSEAAWQLLFVKFLNYIIFQVFKQMSSKSKVRMINKLFLVYLCVPIATLGIMIIIFYSGIDFNKHFSLKVSMTLFFLFMVLGNILLFYAFQKHTENLSENAMQQKELLYHKEEVERLSKMYELHTTHHSLLHDTIHFLKKIGHLAQESRHDEICEIVEKINGKLYDGEIWKYSDDKMLNAILSEYRSKAQSIRINFEAYVEPGSSLDHIEDIDLIAMLGNILDNALSAASEKRGASIKVNIFMQKNGKLCVVKVVNDFVLEPIEVNGKLISTKKEKGIHGIGIANVSKVAKYYGGFFEYYVEERQFHAILVLPGKQKND